MAFAIGASSTRPIRYRNRAVSRISLSVGYPSLGLGKTMRGLFGAFPYFGGEFDDLWNFRSNDLFRRSGGGGACVVGDARSAGYGAVTGGQSGSSGYWARVEPSDSRSQERPRGNQSDELGCLRLFSARGPVDLPENQEGRPVREAVQPAALRFLAGRLPRIRDGHSRATQHAVYQRQAQANNIRRVALDPLDEPASQSVQRARDRDRLTAIDMGG